MLNNISLNTLCYGCRACENICSHNVISMIKDDEGFLYPHIDNKKCTNCGLCVNICPANNADGAKNETGYVLAVQAKKNDILIKSSSGGMFSVIAEYILANDGVVFGAAYDKGLNLRHIEITDIQSLDRLRGSKYFQSDTNSTFNKVKEYLRAGKIVYYTGTPCQIAGLKLFLRKDYENLITSDLICHGTPSGKMFHLFVSHMEKERLCKITDYKFRDKRKGWGCSSSSSSLFLNIFKKEITQDLNMTAYFKAFIQGHITRMDCYNCKFCTPERVGDITIADYWGIQALHADFPGDYRKGVSLVILNTRKAEKLWDKLKDGVFYLNSSIENVLKSDNRNFHSTTPLPPERKDSYVRAFSDFDKFRSNYVKDGFFMYNLKCFYHKLFK